MSWLFDRAGRIRRGGSAAAYAFTPDIDVFVREVVQNAKDQRRDGVDQVKVHFRLIRLRADSLKNFLKAMEFDALRPHLEGAAKASPHASFMQRALDRLDASRELLVLRVSDSGTGGLTGGDLEDNRPFKSLCVDELFSEKAHSGAGGSYGLGKSVLWRFSGISTVLFSSVLDEYPGDERGLRMFGRAQLPWHRVTGHEFDGSSWFGRTGKDGVNPVSLSYWDQDAATLASRLHLTRSDDPGTSILIVGFNPPAEEAVHPRDICHRFCAAATVHFWPVLTGDAPQLQVTSELVDAEDNSVEASYQSTITDEIRPYVECLEAFRSGQTVAELTDKNDVAAASIPVKIPKTLNGEPSVSGAVTLCVKLIPRSTRKGNQVAYARGFGMVVRYRNLEGISLSARPFVAALLCGTLRGESPSDQSVEQFLRLAEPPEHNTWASNQRLQSWYGAGYRKLIEDINREVESIIKRLVSTATVEGEAGPQLLSRMFPIGTSGPDKREHPYSVLKRSASLRPDGRWFFGGELKRKTENASPWEIRVSLKFNTEDTAEVSVVGSVDTEKDVSVTVRSGTAFLLVPGNRSKVKFTGVSDVALHPVESRRAAVRLDISAGVVGEKDKDE